MNQSVVYIGVDVAKGHLDVSWAQEARRFANDKSGRAALVAWIKQSPAAVQLICEASGGYEQALLELLHQRQVKITLVQANRVRQYARAAGILAKTDKVDARVLACFGAAMQPQPSVPRSAEQKQLREFEAQRRHLSAVLVAEQNRLTRLSSAELRSLSRSLIRTVKKQIDTIDARISALISRTKSSGAKRKNSLPLPAWARAPRRWSWPKCPNWANSIAVKPPPSADWPLLTATAAPCVASAPSSVDGALCAAASTWPH